MISNRTNKIPVKQALIVTAILVATAWIGDAYAEDAMKTAATDETAPTQMAGPADADRRFDLQAHGDRFKLAIKAIEEEAKKPCWGWADCPEDDDGHVAGND
jgi:hypothetical protein